MVNFACICSCARLTSSGLVRFMVSFIEYPFAVTVDNRAGFRCALTKLELAGIQSVDNRPRLPSLCRGKARHRQQWDVRRRSTVERLATPPSCLTPHSHFFATHPL